MPWQSQSEWPKRTPRYSLNDGVALTYAWIDEQGTGPSGNCFQRLTAGVTLLLSGV